MRRIAIVNQKGGVGKTTTAANLGAALALAGQRVLLVDLDPQGNLTLHVGLELAPGEPSVYGVLIGQHGLAPAVRTTQTAGLRLVPANIDLSGAEMELAGVFGRETLLRDALDAWLAENDELDFVLFDCPPSLGLLSVNGLVAASEVFIALQTEFFALQGMSQLIDVVRLVQRRLNRGLEITGIVPCLYDSRLRLAREVLAEIRKYFPGEVFRGTVGTNVKLAEAPSYGQTIFEYAPDSNGARDYRRVADEVLGRRDGAVLEPARRKDAAGFPRDGTAVAPTEAPTESGRAGAAGVAPTAPERSGARLVRADDLPPPPVEVFRSPEE